MLLAIRSSWNRLSIGSKMVAILGLSMMIGQGFIIARQTVEENRWRHDSALEVSRVLTVLMANQAGRAIENGDEADLEAIYFDVAYNDADANARSEIAALAAYNLNLDRIKSYVSLDHLGLDEKPLRVHAATAQASRDLVRDDSNGFTTYAVPVFRQHDRALVGTLAVAWDTTAIDEQTQSALISHASFSFVTATVVLILLLFFLRTSVAKPLNLLTKRVLAVERNNHIEEASSGISINRQDEIGLLFREFDAMVKELSEARRRLLEQSYQAGVAESVSGVVHNLRNTLHPVGSAAWKLRRLPQPPQEKFLRSAMDELQDPSTSAEHRDKLIHYLKKGLDRAAETYASMNKQVDIIDGQIAQAERILFSFGLNKKASAQLTAVDLCSVIEDATCLVYQKPNAEMLRIEVDEDIASLPTVLGQEVILLQLVGNLLINAYEAIAAANKLERGRIQISATQEESEERTMVTLSVRDNGHGITPEHLDRVFESGFSTRNKESGGGVGLHWSANSALAMGGELSVASKGPGMGATFYLRLPAETNITLAEEDLA